MVAQRNFALTAIMFFSSLVMANPAPSEFKPHLTDCAAFFGLLSQSNTDLSDQYKSMAFVFSLYAAEAIPSNEMDQEVSLSKKKIFTLISDAKSNNDQAGVAEQLSRCMSTLERAEKVLRPQMSEFNRSLVPKLFE